MLEKDKRYYAKHREKILARKRAYYHANLEKAREIRRRHYDKFTRQFVEYKAECGCVVCGERDAVVLDYHHVGPKRATVNYLIKKHRDAELIWSEIGRCVVLCANCHRRVHAGAVKLPGL